MDRRLIVNRQPAVRQPANLIASLPETDGHTELPHRYSDHLAHLLTPDEQAVYTQLYRLSWGWGKETCFITNPRLSERSNVPLSTMKRVVSKLESKGLIEKLERKFGNHHEQGILYRVLNLSRQPIAGRPIVAHNKEEIKKSNKGRNELSLNTKNCPDCQGSGFWYPGGNERGVAKCKHGRLKRE
jgi:DNA-binding MarR family transcriptional regulator